MSELKIDELATGMLEISDACRAMAGRFTKSKPIYGGPFGGSGEFAVASCACMSLGLHATLYTVLHRKTGVFVGHRLHDQKRGAIADARAFLESIDRRTYMAALKTVEARLENRAKQEARARRKEAGPPPQKKIVSPRVSRRRKQVFEGSKGRCFYCQCELSLDGKWHVEHKIPRALDGTNEPSNLAASCVTCNLQKGDKTAEEFIAQRMERAGMLRAA